MSQSHTNTNQMGASQFFVGHVMWYNPKAEKSLATSAQFATGNGQNGAQEEDVCLTVVPL